METSTEIEAAITALRGAYAAFNRGDIDAAVNRKRCAGLGFKTEIIKDGLEPPGSLRDIPNMWSALTT